MTTMKRLSALLGLLALLLIGHAPAWAQDDDAVVYGVFFFSPTCPHCHEVIQNHWPGIQREFGSQLQVLFVNVQTQGGSQIMRAALEALDIDSNGVPMLIIGEEVLVGSAEIPERTPEIVRAGLEAGGIGLPAIPGIEEIFAQAVAQEAAQEAEATAAPEAEATAVPAAPLEMPTAGGQVSTDALANAVAVLVLALLVGSLFMIVIDLRQQAGGAWRLTRARVQRGMLQLVALVGLGLVISLALGWDGELTVLALAAGEFVVFLALIVTLLRAARRDAPPDWLTPLIAIAGLAVAGYLAFVETSQTEAVCGMVGDCNTVQQSVYARVFGIPIGVLGLAGYVLILLNWGLQRRLPDAPWLQRGMTLMVVFGVAFSAYLTFLEPFVIGATCAWCLTSAVTMLLLFWLRMPPLPEAQAAPRPAVDQPAPGLA